MPKGLPRSMAAAKANNTLPKAAAIAPIATADGSDPATTQALANANKAKINALIAALKTAGLMAS